MPSSCLLDTTIKVTRQNSDVTHAEMALFEPGAKGRGVLDSRQDVLCTGEGNAGVKRRWACEHLRVSFLTLLTHPLGRLNCTGCYAVV